MLARLPPVPVVVFAPRRPRPWRGGTTRAVAAVESRWARTLTRVAIIGALFLLAGSVYGRVSVSLQEFEFRRDAGSFRDHVLAVASQRDVDPGDVVEAVRAAAAQSGVRVDERDIEVIAVPVTARRRAGGATPNHICAATLPDEFDAMDARDRQRFHDAPLPCSSDRWIVGFRATVRATSLLVDEEFTVSRFTWVDGFRPAGRGG